MKLNKQKCILVHILIVKYPSIMLGCINVGIIDIYDWEFNSHALLKNGFYFIDIKFIIVTSL